MEYQDPIIRFDLGAQVFHLTFSLSYFSVICLNVIKQPFLFGIKNITLHDELQIKMQQIFNVYEYHQCRLLQIFL